MGRDLRSWPWPLAILCVFAAPAWGGALHGGRRVQSGGPGLVLLTDPVRDRVLVFDVNGDRPQTLTAFGTPGLLPGQLESPHGAAVNAFRELFVADSMNHRIQVFDLSPVALGRSPRLVRVFGAHGRGAGELDTPAHGVAIPDRTEPQHLVYVADTGNDRVQVFDRKGRATGRFIGGHGAEDGKLDHPAAATFDSKGAVLFVADTGNRRISAFDATTGGFLLKFGQPGSGEGELVAPEGLAVDSSGTVFVADPAARRLARFRPELDPAGAIRGMRYEGAWAFVGESPGSWTHPQSIAIDGKDRVYVCDLADGRCQVFSREGEFLSALDADLDAPGVPPGDLAPNATLPFAVCSNGDTYEVRLKSTPALLPLNAMFGLEVALREGCSSPRPLEDAVLRVEAVMPEHRHGMNSEPQVEALGGGRFRVQGMLLHMSGLWELHFDVTRDGVLERAQVDVVLE